MNIDIFVEQWMGPESLDYYYIDWVVKEVKRLRKALYEVTKTEFFSYLKDVRPNDFLTEILKEMIE